MLRGRSQGEGDHRPRRAVARAAEELQRQGSRLTGWRRALEAATAARWTEGRVAAQDRHLKLAGLGRRRLRIRIGSKAHHLDKLESAEVAQKDPP